MMIYCPECENACSEAAGACPKCGHPLKAPQSPQVVVEQLPQRLWNPGVAAVLSFFIPGLGQLYKSQILSGICWFAIVLIGYLLVIVPGMILHLCCVIGATMGDPYEKR